MWGFLLRFGFGSLWLSPLFMIFEMGWMTGCLWTSGVAALAFHSPVTLLSTTFACHAWKGCGKMCLACLWQAWHTACTTCPACIAAAPDSTAYYVLQISSRCDTLLSQLTFRSCLRSSMLASGITLISLC